MAKIIAPLMLLACAALPLNARPASDTHYTARPVALSSADYDCDALAVNHNLDPSVMRDLKPAHSLDAAAAVLARHGVKYRRFQGTLSLMDVPAAVLENINRTPQGEPFILPDDDSSAICVLLPSPDSI